MPLDGRSSPIVIDQSSEINKVVGSAAVYSKNALGSCSATYEPIEEVETGTGTASGLRFWTSQDHGIYPDPGEGTVLVTGVPFWTDLVRTEPPSAKYGYCLPTSAPQIAQDLQARWDKTLMCDLKRDASCFRTESYSHTEKFTYSTESFSANARFNARRETFAQFDDVAPDLLSQLIEFMIDPFFSPLAQKIWPLLPAIPDLNLVSQAVVSNAPASGTVTAQTKFNTSAILNLHGTLTKGTRDTLAVSWVRSAASLPQHATAPTLVTATLTFTPTKGSPVTVTQSAYFLPTKNSHTTSTSHGRISSVVFAGTVADPMIVIRGTNLGRLPSPDPTQHPSGQNGCPIVSGDNGYDYGTNLYIYFPSGKFSAGRYRPSVGETDCIDLVVTKFTSDEIDLHFGPFYTRNYSKYPFASGSQAVIVVNGATLATTVRFS